MKVKSLLFDHKLSIQEAKMVLISENGEPNTKNKLSVESMNGLEESLQKLRAFRAKFKI
jgi:hypothetical protein